MSLFKTLITFSLVLLLSRAPAQELNCNVQVLAPQIVNTDKKIFETLQTSIFEFMNNRKWTNDAFMNQERIECTIVITISERVSTDEFKGTIQVQSRRPVYKSSYNSTMLNVMDEHFTFRYVEYQPLDLNEQTFVSNLTSVLAFYAYVIIGMDYDSFSPEGGTPYYQKAQLVVNNAQNAPDKGWRAFDGIRSRYWLIENLLNQSFRPVREVLYRYHRKGFDIMTEKLEDGRKEIIESLQLLKKVYQEKPNSMLLAVFFDAKSDEIVNTFSSAFPEDKNKIVNLLSEIDPAHSSKYQNILKSN